MVLNPRARPGEVLEAKRMGVGVDAVLLHGAETAADRACREGGLRKDRG